MVATPHTISKQQCARLRKALGGAKSKRELYEKIVNSPFTDRSIAPLFDLGIVVLLLVNKRRKTIDRVALSNTEQALGAVKVSAKPFRSIRVPLASRKNVIARAIRNGQHYLIDDWQYLFTPILSPTEARLNQAAASIESSLVWPLVMQDGGALIFSFYQPLSNIGDDHLEFAQYYASMVDGAHTELTKQ